VNSKTKSWHHMLCKVRPPSDVPLGLEQQQREARAAIDDGRHGRDAHISDPRMPLDIVSSSQSPPAPFFAPASIVLQSPVGADCLKDDKEVDDQIPRRKGLSPFMFFSNKMVKATKESAGRMLTQDELREAKQAAKDAWNHLADKAPYEELYKLWLERPAAPATNAVQKAYKPLWASGCSASPVSASELCDYYRQYGWPSDKEVYETKKSRVSATDSIDWNESKDYNLYGCLRSAHNVCHADASGCANYTLVHTGLFNYLESLPKAEAESGTVMLLLEGLQATDNMARRTVVSYTGTCWSPKVFEVAIHEFVEAEFACAEELRYPFDVVLTKRLCKVSDRFTCIGDETSAAWVWMLVTYIHQVGPLQSGVHYTNHRSEFEVFSHLWVDTHRRVARGWLEGTFAR
jgi:hypothetical protein